MSVNTYFHIEYGQDDYNSKGWLKKGNIPIISSSSKDNGLYYCADVVPYYLNVISMPRTGSIGEARVHDYHCCIDNNCLVLIPKTNSINLDQLYYTAAILKQNKWRFTYGRQVTPSRIADIELPLFNMIDKIWNKPNIKDEKIKNNFVNLMNSLYNKYLDDIFFILKGEGSYYEKCKPGKTPLISATSEDNGIIGFVDLLPKFNAPAITIERVSGKAHIQTVDFVTVPDDIFVLVPKEPIDNNMLILIATLLNLNRWRFNYSRKVTKKRLETIFFDIDKGNKIIKIKILRKIKS